MTAIILFVLMAADVTDLGIVDSTHGFNFTVPKNRTDIMGLELCFMPRTDPTNAAVTMTLSKAQAENMTMTGENVPEDVQDGRVVLGMRWVLTSGRKGKWRLGAFDLWREEPEPPTATQTFVSDGASGLDSRTHGLSNHDAPYGQGQRFDSASIHQSTNDAPVRAWHGAQAVVKDSLTPDPELARAIAEHFNRPANPPPMPPSTNTNESATKRAMLEFYKHGPKR